MSREDLEHMGQLACGSSNLLFWDRFATKACTHGTSDGPAMMGLRGNMGLLMTLSTRSAYVSRLRVTPGMCQDAQQALSISFSMAKCHRWPTRKREATWHCATMLFGFPDVKWCLHAMRSSTLAFTLLEGGFLGLPC